MSSGSKPTISVLMPNGLTPPLCVYLCCTPATYLVIYSIETGSSTVRRCDCASNLALSMRILASAFRPAKARQTWVSTSPIFEGVIRVSWSFIADLFSHPKTTISFPFTPTAQVPIINQLRRRSSRRMMRSHLSSQPQAHILPGRRAHRDCSLSA